MDSLIVFGVALGKQIETLVKKVDIKNLYICEPNLDFFYASLFVTDWDAIFTSIDKENKRIYLNIGGDGTVYFSDFMAQFYQVGAFAIANTYMFSSYFSPELLNAAQSLKRQLKVVLTMGEYYDHARYGIAHTYISLETEHKFMKKDRTVTDTLAAKNIPVFIIGNGPSLDQSIDYIKEHRARVIVVSCGTTIRSLYQLGIQPDFHAEVEQNRATFDWITQVNDRAYLKGIKIISVNGLHPDTASLFAQSYLAFKSGEASTQLFQTALAKRGFDVASLAYAYPTVSNMVLSYVLEMGFKTIYLFGVDLGYTDVAQHHSKHSAYYTSSGAEVYDYKAFHGNAMAVKGNFRPLVYTKPEFDVSRQVLEQVIATMQPDVEIYNCSDGAMIKGAVALAPHNILLGHEITDIATALEHYLSELYFSQSLSAFAKPILDFYDLNLLSDSISQWQKLVAQPVTTVLEAKESINKQWEFIKAESTDKHNLLFYLFYGSTNYFLSVLTKVLPKSENNAQDFIRFNQVRQYWHDYLADALDDFVSQPIIADKVKVNYLPKLATKGM
ncbi:motility associated factor glycosyltransferase family protein [Rheinheimera salexigens]|uniref:motility associated factor glycosyltransferase family protein n=1 Tax=Rheinheimera salexigens TaxID=1628148 RepID=UPI0039F0C1B6